MKNTLFFSSLPSNYRDFEVKRCGFSVGRMEIWGDKLHEMETKQFVWNESYYKNVRAINQAIYKWTMMES